MDETRYPQNGIVYCATGKRFVNEVINSAKSLHKFNKEPKITIFTDKDNVLKNEMDLFDSIIIIDHPEFSFGDKVFAIKNTPYKKTIFLDTDTIITDDISELFRILEKFDIALVNVPYKNRKYPFYNTGVIAFNKNQRIMDLFKLWEQKYDKRIGNDQPPFQEALLQSSISVFTLPPEYNFRVLFTSYAQKRIKILHGHNIVSMNYLKRDYLINLLNEHLAERFWFPGKGILKLKYKSKFYVKFLYFIEEKFFMKLNRIWKHFPRKKFINYSILYYFPGFSNWGIPKQYRERILRLNKRIIKFL